MKTFLGCLSLLLFSCTSYKAVKDKELQDLNKKLEGKFLSANAAPDSTRFPTNVQSLFGIANSDSVIGVKVNDKSELELRYKNHLGGNETRAFKGKFKKKSFKVFLEKKRVTLPPVYWVTNVNRLHLGLDKKGTLIINKHYDHSGMILLLAGGSSFDHQYSFNPSKKQ